MVITSLFYLLHNVAHFTVLLLAQRDENINILLFLWLTKEWLLVKFQASEYCLIFSFHYTSLYSSALCEAQQNLVTFFKTSSLYKRKRLWNRYVKLRYTDLIFITNIFQYYVCCSTLWERRNLCVDIQCKKCLLVIRFVSSRIRGMW
jgi:hypothetical protein